MSNSGNEITKEKKARKPRYGNVKPIGVKAKKFAQEYVKSLNGTQAALIAYDTESPAVAASIATENLRKPVVASYIEELLARAITDDELLALHVRNAKQTEQLVVSQRAIESLEEIKGIKKTVESKEITTQNNVFIQNIQHKVNDFEQSLKDALYGKTN